MVTSIQFVFIIIKFLEIAIFFIFGNRMAKSNCKSEYWKNALFPILSFAIVDGLRFGRLIDWNVYYFRYNEIGRNILSHDYEWLFMQLSHWIYKLGIPYPGFIFLQSLFYIVCVVILLYNFKEHLLYILPLALVFSSANEMFIRWYIAFSFLLLSISFLINRKYIVSGLWFMCAFLCHSGIVMFISFYLFINFINKKIIPIKVSIALCFLTHFILSLSDLLFISKFADFLYANGLSNLSVGRYLNATTDLLSGEWGKVGIMERSISFFIRSFLSYIPTIYFGAKLVDKYNYGVFFYNLAIVGCIISPLFVQIEIFNRFAISLCFFNCIVSGIVFGHIFSKQQIQRFSPNTFWIIVFSFILTIYPYFSMVISRGDDKLMMFIWDANGRNYLPY